MAMSHSHTGVPVSREHEEHARNHYGRLLVMTILSFIAMYVLMYAMVDSIDNVLHNVNQVYMAGLMAAAMVIIELVVMRGMYRSRALNALVITLSIAALAGFWLAIRGQGGVGDRQFLRSMIPHHASAILMCSQAGVRDREIQQLCQSIIDSQADEIRQMKAKLAALDA